MAYRATEEKELHRFFEIGLFLKGADGFLELVGGALLLLISPETINNIVLFFGKYELAEDPKDVVLTYVLHLTQNLPLHTEVFYGLLFMSHGAIKLFLIAGLIRDKLWAYPTTIGVFALFIAYQIYQMSIDPSAFLGAITMVDVLVVILIAHEYRHAKKRHAARAKN